MKSPLLTHPTSAGSLCSREQQQVNAAGHLLGSTHVVTCRAMQHVWSDATGHAELWSGEAFPLLTTLDISNNSGLNGSLPSLPAEMGLVNLQTFRLGSCSFKGERSHERCCCHLLQLIIETFCRIRSLKSFYQRLHEAPCRNVQPTAARKLY